MCVCVVPGLLSVCVCLCLCSYSSALCVLVGVVFLFSFGFVYVVCGVVRDVVRVADSLFVYVCVCSWTRVCVCMSVIKGVRVKRERERERRFITRYKVIIFHVLPITGSETIVSNANSQYFLRQGLEDRWCGLWTSGKLRRQRSQARLNNRQSHLFVMLTQESDIELGKLKCSSR